MFIESDVGSGGRERRQSTESKAELSSVHFLIQSLSKSKDWVGERSGNGSGNPGGGHRINLAAVVA
jgi:hypothetical protein